MRWLIVITVIFAVLGVTCFTVYSLAVPKKAPVAVPTGCTEVATWAAVVSIACPRDTNPKALGTWLRHVADERLLKISFQQVHLIVSDSREAAPTSGGFLDDAWTGDRTIATAHLNLKTGHRSMDCRQKTGAPLSDCTFMFPY
jgi:hypothetical protein